MKVITLCLLALFVALIVACGGGGGPASNTPPPLRSGAVPTSTPWASPPAVTFLDGSPRPGATGSPRPTGGQTTYTVQAGDTLFAIAARFGVDLQELIRVNNITNPANLSVGQVLVIPAAGTPRPTTSPQATASPQPTVTPTPTPGGQVGACTNPYIVQAGDYPGLIAQKCGVDVNELIVLNGILDPTALQVGQQLRLPPR